MVANGVPGLALAVTRGTRVTHLRGYGDAGDGRRRLPRDDAAPAEQHRRAGGQPADGQTGERAGDAFHYFDPNYAVLARLVEVVSGRPLSAYLRAHLFAQLAMTGSTSVVTTALAPSAAPGPGPGSHRGRRRLEVAEAATLEAVASGPAVAGRARDRRPVHLGAPDPARPTLVVRLSGRLLSWRALFLAVPDLLGCLAVAAMLGAALGTARAVTLITHTRKGRTVRRNPTRNGTSE